MDVVGEEEVEKEMRKTVLVKGRERSFLVLIEEREVERGVEVKLRILKECKPFSQH